MNDTEIQFDPLNPKLQDFQVSHIQNLKWNYENLAWTFLVPIFSQKFYTGKACKGLYREAEFGGLHFIIKLSEAQFSSIRSTFIDQMIQFFRIQKED